MGSLVKLVDVFNVQASLNIRFSAGDPIDEMAALHREFEIFAPSHDLRAAAALLGLAPEGEPRRGEWLDYLDHLKTLPSNKTGENGHDRIRSAIAENLEMPTPMPVFFRYHSGSEDERVLITSGKPLIFLETAYLVVSVPTMIAREAMRAAIERAGSWSSRKPAKTSAKPSAKSAKAPAKKSARK